MNNKVHVPAPAPTLQTLAQLCDAQVYHAPAEAFPVSFIGLDSSSIEAGGVFAALPGTRVHGATYASQCPAGAILTDDEGWEILKRASEQRPVLVVENVRAVLGKISAEVYGHPSEQLVLMGVTGTSGKTTTTYMLEQGLVAAGHKVGLIGTTGTKILGEYVPTSLTTPEAPTLQRLFAQMLAAGVTHVVMEVSSHALMLGRISGTAFNVAGFSNLSQDHLDFHPTMEDYFEAKALFFDPESDSAAAQAVVCVDDAWGERMAQRAAKPVVVGTHGQAGLDVAAELLAVDEVGRQEVRLSTRSLQTTFTLPMPGAFNIANAALAVGMAEAVGVDVEKFVAGLTRAAVPGRMERIDCGQDFVAVVDYAHKPAAIAAVLDTLRGQVSGRIGVAVGAGGNRDSSKRAIMGKESALRADFVVVTDDNPRDEDPAQIRQQVLAGAHAAIEGVDAARGVEVREIGDRRAAIETLVAWAQPGDAVVVVGKGHEVGQIVGGTTHHFDDREEMRRALQARKEHEQ